MTRRWAGPLAGVLAVLALAGCAGPTPAPQAAPLAPAPAAPALPPRPVELPMAGLNPCDLLTPAQLRTTFRIPYAGEFRADTDQFGSSSCSWGTSNVPPNGSPLARMITKVPAETYLQNGNPSTVVDIAGFAAVQTTGGGDPLNHCLVLVDVAAGQTLWTQYDLDIYRQLPTDQICVSARKFAEAMVTTLRAQLRR